VKTRLGALLLTATACLSGCGSGGPANVGVPMFTIGGTVGGLAGSGLVLQLNGGGNLGVTTNGGFAFAARLANGAAYTASVLAQPTAPSQTCTVTNGSGTAGSANVASISVSCTTNSFTIGGTVSGLTGTGLVLQNNVGNNLPIGGNGAFTFTTPILSGATYAVTVSTQPTVPVQNCIVTSGSGTVGAANVTNVGVNCNNTFTIGSLSDPLATQQWHLKNTGQNAFADTGGVMGMDINAEPVYSTFGFTGNGVITAVVDTGLEIAHEDLAANVVPNGSWNFNTSTTDPTNTTVTTGDHGTSVSGLIAMARNAVGGIGVAPSARLKGFNFLSSDQAEQKFLDSLGASTVSPNSSDVFIFNQSFGFSPTSDIPIDPMDEAQYLAGVISLRAGKGALYVKAAGNGFLGFHDSATNTPAVCSPANSAGLSCENANFDPTNTVPYQIVVGATNASGVRADYSTAGSAIWVNAPGGEFGRNALRAPGFIPIVYSPAMVTTDQSGCAKGFSTTTVENGSAFDDGGAPNTACNYTNGMNGTSSATPVTVGVIALILEANPALTWRDVKHILASTARQIDASRAAINVTLSDGQYVAEPGWTPNAASFKFHNWYGFGMVDASAAVNMARAYALGQLGTFANTGLISSGAINIVIPDNSATGSAPSTLTVPANPVHVIEAVQISVTATHPATGDLGIELLSPLGTRSVLKNIRDGFAGSADLNGMVLLSNAFYGENPAGIWTIKLVDGAAGNTGTLTRWTIRVYGH
jgi:subtilisin-like proprotein convertase family protein/subtilisin family serine protease